MCRREKIIPLYKVETWSADLIEKSSLGKYKINYKFILTVLNIIRKFSLTIPLKDNSGISVINGFKIA